MTKLTKEQRIKLREIKQILAHDIKLHKSKYKRDIIKIKEEYKQKKDNYRKSPKLLTIKPYARKKWHNIWLRGLKADLDMVLFNLKRNYEMKLEQLSQPIGPRHFPFRNLTNPFEVSNPHKKPKSKKKALGNPHKKPKAKKKSIVKLIRKYKGKK